MLAHGIAVDGSGNAYVTGTAGSTNFPTANPLQTSYGGFGDAFVLSISAPVQISSATHFVPVTPCRIADTRNRQRAFRRASHRRGHIPRFCDPQQRLRHSVQRSRLFDERGGGSSRDAGISDAVALRAIAAAGGHAQFDRWQGQIQRRDRAGRFNGAVSVFATDTTDVILDINGYFVAGSSPTALAFYPLTPCRIADTRNATAPLGGPSLAAQSTRSFPILASSCGLPADAQAYSLNFAAVPKGPTLGFLTAWPAGQPQPLVASLNDPTGTVLANAVIVPAGTGGAVNVFATDATDLVIDINGYFAPPGPGGLSLYTVTPCRVLDSRLPAGSPPFSTTRDVNVTASSCGVPATAQAFVFNATVVPPGFLGFITMWPQGQTQPLAATLNAYDGAVTNNMAIVPTTTGSVSVFPSAPTHLVLLSLARSQAGSFSSL